MLKCFKPSIRGGGDGEDFHFKTRSFPEPGFTEMSSSASMFLSVFGSCASHSVPYVYIYIYLEKIIRSVLLLRDVNGSGKRLKAPSLLLKGRESRVLKHLSWCILQPAPNNYAGKNAVNVS